MIIDSKVVLGELLDLTDLLRAQVFCIYETTEVIMIHKNENLIFATFQVIAPGFKCFNNS